MGKKLRAKVAMFTGASVSMCFIAACALYAWQRYWESEIDYLSLYQLNAAAREVLFDAHVYGVNSDDARAEIAFATIDGRVTVGEAANIRSALRQVRFRIDNERSRRLARQMLMPMSKPCAPHLGCW